jgi:hypothetical protein
VGFAVSADMTPSIRAEIEKLPEMPGISGIDISWF